jgi:drug/metabolite transporter (DMT)-like permease
VNNKPTLANFFLLLQVTVVVTCFAANSIITRYLLTDNKIDPVTLTSIRFISGFLMLFALVRIKPKSFIRGTLGRLHLLGALFLGIYAFSISFGYRYISASAGTLVFYFTVVFTMSISSVIIDHDRLSLTTLIGQIMGILGVLVTCFSKIEVVTGLGILLMILTGAGWGIYSVIGKRLNAAFSYSYYSFFLLSLILVSILISTIIAQGPPKITPKNWALSIYLGTTSTALSYVLWHRVLKKIKSFQGGIAQLTVPIITGLMGILLLHEQVNQRLLLGATLILTGVFLNMSPP